MFSLLLHSGVLGPGDLHGFGPTIIKVPNAGNSNIDYFIDRAAEAMHDYSL